MGPDTLRPIKESVILSDVFMAVPVLGMLTFTTFWYLYTQHAGLFEVAHVSDRLVRNRFNRKIQMNEEVMGVTVS